MSTYLDGANKKVKGLKIVYFDQTSQKQTPANSEQFWPEPWVSTILGFDSITKNANSQLHNHFCNMEKQYLANAQYSRRKRMEIVGITASVPDNKLEKTLCKFVSMMKLKLMIRILNPVIVLAVTAVW